MLRLKIRLSEFLQGSEDYCAFCTNCGQIVDGLEPDTRKHKCPECGKKTVYGFQELAIEDWVDLTDKDEESDYWERMHND